MSSISPAVACILLSLLSSLALGQDDGMAVYELPIERGESSRPIVQFKRGEAIRLCIMRQNCFNHEKGSRLRKYFNILSDIRNPDRK